MNAIHTAHQPQDYRSFLEAKIKLAAFAGFDVTDTEINPLLKPHQRVIVRWAIKGGRRAIFAAFGLGKSVIQLEILRLILARVGGRGLIITPLGVRQEFRRDADMLGIAITFIRSIDEAGETGLYLTNYETVRDGKLDPNQFAAVSLDEASVLRSFGSKTYQTFLGLFRDVRFRFVCTATPSPNRYKELIHYGGFLGIMDTGQALTRWFQRDSSKAGNLTLYSHKEDEFWLWLNSWALFIQTPSDLGFDDTGYDQPPLTVIPHVVSTAPTGFKVERNGQGQLIEDAAVGVQDAARVKRNSLSARIEELKAILQADPDSHYLLWHDLESERMAIEAAVPGAVSVYGTQELDEREQAIIDFSDGRFQYLAAKPIIAGSGCNFQRHCHKAVFLGIGFKFNDFIQSIHRIQRFLQSQPVEIHVIYADTERRVWRDLQAKWSRHNDMVAKMTKIIREHGLNAAQMAEVLTRTIGVKRIEASGEGWAVANNDCVDETKHMETNSVDLIVTSIPFGNHYEYCASYNDFGHTDDDAHFFGQMDFLTPELLRVLKPGRLACVHVKDRILFGNVTGFGRPTVNPFHMKTAMHFIAHGFLYMGMRTVVTDVVRENNQTYRLGYTEMRKDASKMGCGSPEYILLLAKPQSDLTKGYADERVTKERRHWDPDIGVDEGLSLLSPDERAAAQRELSQAIDDLAIAFEAADRNGDDEEAVNAARKRLDSIRHRLAVGKKTGGWSNPDGYSLARWQVDAHAFWRSSGNRMLTPDELAGLGPDKLAKLFTAWSLAGVYDFEAHVRIGEELEARGALPSTFMALAPGSHDPAVWHDINRMRTLNTNQAAKGRELHVCPFQLDIVDRLITLYSNRGELVYDPFGGLFSVPHQALELGRRGRAAELNTGYFFDGVKYLQAKEKALSTPTLFDLMGGEAA